MADKSVKKYRIFDTNLMMQIELEVSGGDGRDNCTSGSVLSATEK